jgi:hypothetical protein
MTAWDVYVDTVITLGKAKTHLAALTEYIIELDEQCNTGATSNTEYQLSRIAFELNVIEDYLKGNLSKAKQG